MVQVVEMTHDEKVAMYMKQPKKKLVEMLIQCNLYLEFFTKQLQIHNVSGQVCRSFFPDNTGTAGNICKWCGKESWQH